MHIMTSNGWRALSPKQCQPMANDHGRYTGPLPSPRIEAYAAELDRARAEYLAQRAGREHV